MAFIFLPRFSIATYGLIPAFKKCEFGKTQNYKVVVVEVTILENPTLSQLRFWGESQTQSTN